MMSLEKTGTIAFRAGHEDADWLTNNKLYRFQSPTHSGISVEVVKHSDRTLEVTLAGTRQSDTAFRHIVPHGATYTLHVAVTWDGPDVKLYLEGSPIETKTIEQSP
jgi:hypothetical protein